MSAEDQRTILVADQDESFRRQLREGFAGEPYRLVLTATEEEAWAELERQTPDLVLLDASAQGLDGFDLCRRLKLRKETREVPVVLISAASEEQHILRGFEEGADDLLRKPLSVAYLKTKIRVWLARASRARAGEGAGRPPEEPPTQA